MMSADTFLKSPRAWTGRRVLWMALGFFGVVFAVNGALVAFAVSTWSGLATENAYLKGLRYNETIAAAKKQETVGWTSEVHLNPGNVGTGTLVIRFVDRQGRALSGLDVTARLSRPTSARFDHTPKVVDGGDGTYIGAVPALSTGQWVVDVSALDNRGAEYTMTHRVVVQP